MPNSDQTPSGASAESNQELQSQLLAVGLRTLLGTLDDDVMRTIEGLIDRIELTAGEAIVREGDTGDDVYCILSGRLRAHTGSGAERRFLTEMRPGEILGEVSFLTGTARTATVTAVRDSVLARLTHAHLEDVLARYPHVTLNMARLIANRLIRANTRRQAPQRPGNLCLLPVSALPAEWSPAVIGARLVAASGGQAKLLTAESIGQMLGDAHAAQVSKSDPHAFARLTRELDHLETSFSPVVYVPDTDLESPWSQRCLRMADRIVLLADATASPEPSPIERSILNEQQRITQAEQTLVLLHDAQTPSPIETSKWLHVRTHIDKHIHVRPTLDLDIARLMRMLTGRAIGLVFAGGGARCLAQLGAYKALREAGIPIDHVGGTGFGAVMAALVALDIPPDDAIAQAREAFRVSPTGDISMLPISALVKGKRLQQVLRRLFDSLIGPTAAIEDTWRTLFFVAANSSRARESVLVRGALVKSLRAACALPGLLPPVPIDGELMVDGGAFNNFPIDVMARLGAGNLIGVRIARDRIDNFAGDEVPGNISLLADALAGRRRKYHMPSLMQSIINGATMYSASREPAAEAAADICVSLHLGRIGLLDWMKFEHAVSSGYKQTKKALSDMPPEQYTLLGT